MHLPNAEQSRSDLESEACDDPDAAIRHTAAPYFAALPRLSDFSDEEANYYITT